MCVSRHVYLMVSVLEVFVPLENLASNVIVRTIYFVLAMPEFLALVRFMRQAFNCWCDLSETAERCVAHNNEDGLPEKSSS